MIKINVAKAAGSSLTALRIPTAIVLYQHIEPEGSLGIRNCCKMQKIGLTWFNISYNYIYILGIYYLEIKKVSFAKDFTNKTWKDQT